jgi:hypothetical protein
MLILICRCRRVWANITAIILLLRPWLQVRILPGRGCLMCVRVFLCLCCTVFNWRPCDELITRPRSPTVCERSRNWLWVISPVLQHGSEIPSKGARGGKSVNNNYSFQYIKNNNNNKSVFHFFQTLNAQLSGSECRREIKRNSREENEE